ncbi:sigma-70 family RNA polymerase sigma factor [Sphingopyxis panaciterrulae]|uniref:RNA polymerase sigma-70 factor (ECF subfamily) n=1 Tax=Sphingopyxis panaciterrulae TaxID=462372 RepID=A0A7W9ERB3_9SPHN|nr:RNA polymerase sigma-70 factor (ECF subfamily) [Sphingopyxis panaciterrulae]
MAVAHVQAFGLKAAAHASSMFSTPGISTALPSVWKANSMDSEHRADGVRQRVNGEGYSQGDETTHRSREAAIEAIYTAHRPQLVSFLRRRADPQDIGDLVQDCFLRLVASKDEVVAKIEKPGAYLVRAARNIFADRSRVMKLGAKARHHVYEDEEFSGPDPHNALEARDMMRRVEERLSRLKPKTRDIFLMHRFDGMSYEEIAAKTGMSEKGVEKQIAKAMTALLRIKASR